MAALPAAALMRGKLHVQGVLRTDSIGIQVTHVDSYAAIDIIEQRKTACLANLHAAHFHRIMRALAQATVFLLRSLHYDIAAFEKRGFATAPNLMKP